MPLKTAKVGDSQVGEKAAMRPILVFTDMDGTLLDHHTYSFAPAQPALDVLNRAGIPLILNTSKTYSEIVELQQKLGISAPFIVENGAAAYLPLSMLGSPPDARLQAPGMSLSRQNGFWRLELAKGRAEILELIHQWRDDGAFRFKGFADFSVPEVCTLTGLGRDDAIAAMDRHYSEPIRWQGSDRDWEEFATRLKAKGLQALRGGRFTHIMWPICEGACDKGCAMRAVAALLYPDQEAICIALGDSDNDVAMLAEADYGIVIRSPVHEAPVIATAKGQLVHSQQTGPEGWNETMQPLLEKLLGGTEVKPQR